MTFFNFLGLCINAFLSMLNIVIIDEDNYVVSLGGLFLGLFLISVIFRLLFSFAGIVGGSVPNASGISSNLHSYSVSRTRERESKLPRTSHFRTTFDKKSGVRTTTSWRD